MHAPDGLIQRFIELKVRFCKFKCIQSQGSLHRSLKIKDKETKKWWLTISLLTLKSKRCHPSVRAASVRITMQTKMATSSTRPADSHPRFLKLLTRFHKKSTHRNLLRTLMYKTQKKSSTTEPPRTATNGHKFPTNSRVSHSSLCKSKKNFTKPMPPLDPSTSDLQNPGKSTPKVQPRATTRRQNLSIHRGIILQICENLFKISQN